MIGRRGLTVVSACGLITAAALAVGPAGQPDWRTLDEGDVAVFGDVKHGGFYNVSKRPISLRELVVSAGLPDQFDRLSVQLRRVDAAGKTKLAEVEMKDLRNDGNVSVQANDVVQVIAIKAAG